MHYWTLEEILLNSKHEGGLLEPYRSMTDEELLQWIAVRRAELGARSPEEQKEYCQQLSREWQTKQGQKN